MIGDLELELDPVEDFVFELDEVAELDPVVVLVDDIEAVDVGENRIVIELNPDRVAVFVVVEDCVGSNARFIRVLLLK